MQIAQKLYQGIEIDGETYKTFPITISVSAAVNKPNVNPEASEIAADKIHLVGPVQTPKYAAAVVADKSPAISAVI